VTSNLTSGSSDLISRGLPVRLHFEGNPVERSFRHNPLTYAVRHRLEILGEAAALVLRWKKAGKPDARDVWPAGRPPPRHRCERWVQIIGGILAVNGFTNFLSNVEEAKAAMDEGLQALAVLAEHVSLRKVDGYYNPQEGDLHWGKLPREWVRVFLDAEVFRDRLADKNARGRDTFVGTFLSGKTDRAVAVTVGAAGGTAVLRRNAVRNDQKRYYFEITLSSSAPPPDAQQGALPGEGNVQAAADVGTLVTTTPPVTAFAGAAEIVSTRATALPADGGNDLPWD
jgi:hypothetical protein